MKHEISYLSPPLFLAPSPWMMHCSKSDPVQINNNIGSGNGNGGDPSGSKRNVLFIMADDFNYWTHDIGYYPASITPNIDKLGTKGVLFRNVFCPSPVSNPSLNAMWSGFRASTTGITNNSHGYIRDKAGGYIVVTDESTASIERF